VFAGPPCATPKGPTWRAGVQWTHSFADLAELALLAALLESDFQAALDELDECEDQEAPSPDEASLMKGGVRGVVRFAGDSASIEHLLNDLGRDGWELVTTQTTGVLFRLSFKRLRSRSR
jgi:hypothetical protein